ncbi:MAG TPA: Glu/Leu/Phe/Val dehydrogenase dimerization domain-containing protein [Sphingobacterium bovisgrunnientis]|jgi:leucine dehydrogenase|uniref:Glu/Leu/Phe/Val family dehydrogenase n=1 Tax=Sphingobacterium TaxID=28453 RepID=UPI00122FC075|nr:MULTISPECIES: Glu/Leu/Phe/Val dehydrogenase dimerization domain-containing protein [Sphingobacterium]HLS37946.1 Glu/Leu/Phe/Val dehydrogenase dimerization domain-containing protein [Sphingobacterium bovisgrunnientis]
MQNSTIFSLMANADHQNLFFCNDPAVGLKAIVAIHDTTLGPAIGGVRMLPYESEEEAIEDALRLSKAITYKSSLAGLNLGGGCAVIIGNNRTDKTEVLMRRVGKFIEGLNGNFIASIDVGTTQRDLEYIHAETNYVAGLPTSMNGGGDTTVFAARGVFYGIKAAIKELYGDDSLAGRKVAVQGVGSVGEQLIAMLRNENARVYVSDMTEERNLKVAAKYKAEPIQYATSYELDVDVYAPCALGGTVNPDTVPKMRCKIIAGSANNQLKEEEKTIQLLKEHNILYTPDFLINSGALISCYSELEGYGNDRTESLIRNIYTATRHVLQRAREENITTYEAAKQLAEKRIADMSKIKR